MDIEAILQWAYRHELPKSAEMSGVGRGTAAGFSGAGGGNAKWEFEPGFPAFLGSPHPDALVVGEAVHGLATIEIDAVASREELLPEAWRLIEPNDWLRTRVRVDRAVYVVSHAKMGNRPEWRAGWSVNRVIGRNGKPAVDGIDENGHYGRGARCPLEIVPHPREILTDRAIYAAWHGALVEIANRLGDSLESLEVRPPDAPARPWIDGDDEPPKIIADLTKPMVSTGTRRVGRKGGA